MNRAERWEPGENRIGVPEPGFYAAKLCRRGPEVPCSIVSIGDMWSAVVNGEMAGEPTRDPHANEQVMRIWHHARRIDVEEHRYLEALRAWAAKHSPRHPLLHPYVPVDVAVLPPVVP